MNGYLPGYSKRTANHYVAESPYHEFDIRSCAPASCPESGQLEERCGQFHGHDADLRTVVERWALEQGSARSTTFSLRETARRSEEEFWHSLIAIDNPRTV